MPIPSELLEHKQWVLWRRTSVNGRTAKLPISSWSGKLASLMISLKHGALIGTFVTLAEGIGFVFTSKDPFCGIDLDRCRTRDGKDRAGSAGHSR